MLNIARPGISNLETLHIPLNLRVGEMPRPKNKQTKKPQKDKTPV